MSKKVSFSKPIKKEGAIDSWVKGSEVTSAKETEQTKRIVLDVPVSWHRKIKSICAERGVKMNTEILPLLKRHFSLND